MLVLLHAPFWFRVRKYNNSFFLFFKLHYTLFDLRISGVRGDFIDNAKKYYHRMIQFSTPSEAPDSSQALNVSIVDFVSSFLGSFAYFVSGEGGGDD